jgi:uncharacterized membrane protein
LIEKDSSMLHSMTSLAYVLHVSSGVVALFSGAIAMTARKGGVLHRAAGNTFFAAMLLMALFAGYLGVVVPDQLVNVFIAMFTAYLVATAWLTGRARNAVTGLFEKLLLGVSLSLCAPFVILSFQLATGLPPLVKSAVPFEGPVLVAVYVLTTVLVVAALSDAGVVAQGGISGTPRVARHLWRMSLGLALAAGSAFTNGLPRILPPGVHVPLAWLFAPQLSVLALLIIWMIRVRVMGWSMRSEMRA